MIKLIKILSEIKLIQKRNFPNEISWIYDIKNYNEFEKVLKKLHKLGYVWRSGTSVASWPFKPYTPEWLNRYIIHNKNEKNIISFIRDINYEKENFEDYIKLK